MISILIKGQILTTSGPASVQKLKEAVVTALYQSYPERFK